MSDDASDAQRAIGTDAPMDWAFTPSAHAKALGAEAGALKRIISRSDFEELSNTFEVSDQAAVRAQTCYKRFAVTSGVLSFLATVIAGGLLLAYARGIPWHLDLSLIGGIQGALLATSLLLSLIIAHRKPFDDWMRERATAEHQRILYFNKVIDVEEPATAEELPVLPLQLEYFRRFQLDVQKKYYRERSAEHRRAMNWATGFRWLGTILILIAGAPVVAPLLGMDWSAWHAENGLPFWVQDLDFQQRIFIALSTTGAALQGLLAAFAVVNQNERNAHRYMATFQNLEALSSRPLDEARTSAERGDKTAVRTFVALVQEQISSEHREWVSLQSVVPDLSLDRLKELSLPRI